MTTGGWFVPSQPPYALLKSQVKEDVFVTSRHRVADAIIMGNANLDKVNL